MYMYRDIIWYMFYILYNIFCILIEYLNTYCKNLFDIETPLFFSSLLIETNLLQLSYKAVAKN